MQKLFQHLAFIFKKTWNRVYKFWVRPELQSMICLDLLTSVHYCNCMTWYQVISAWLVKQNMYQWSVSKITRAWVDAMISFYRMCPWFDHNGGKFSSSLLDQCQPSIMRNLGSCKYIVAIMVLKSKNDYG